MLHHHSGGHCWRTQEGECSKDSDSSAARYASEYVPIHSVCNPKVFHFTVIPAPVMVIANITADNTNISVSWEWSRQGVPMCVDLVQVHYQPEGGSLMRYPVSNTTATSATLPNLQCNTNYTVWVYAESGSNKTGNMSVPRMVSIPPRGMCMCFLKFSCCF